MKKVLLLVVMASALSFSVFADGGHGGGEEGNTDILKDIGDAVVIGLETFKSENLELEGDFKGVRASSKNGGIQVKIYTKSNGNLSYSCHRHSSADPFECHQAQ